MIFRVKDIANTVLRPRITPDPAQVESLRRRMTALSYQPINGFHRDMRQNRMAPRIRG